MQKRQHLHYSFASLKFNTALTLSIHPASGGLHSTVEDGQRVGIRPPSELPAAQAGDIRRDQGQVTFHQSRAQPLPSPPPCPPPTRLTASAATTSRAAAAAAAGTAAAAGEPGSILVTLPDGARAAWPRGRTTPLDVARNVSRRLADAAVAAKARDRRDSGGAGEGGDEGGGLGARAG